MNINNNIVIVLIKLNVLSKFTLLSCLIPTKDTPQYNFLELNSGLGSENKMFFYIC